MVEQTVVACVGQGVDALVDAVGAEEELVEAGALQSLCVRGHDLRQVEEAQVDQVGQFVQR
ncbi:hypothetical protein [Streptomyces albidoflavus]|uniref:hypothetical protein n=1 Tax=Streptomyces albidoflavus TaxID=1886 RepID=UPI00101E6243|nr:hypothetical protein [Streptomyces albidoflavus]RZD92240.1 hypothetical protein C0Q63_00220 [Streptomyces albidoflavus]